MNKQHQTTLPNSKEYNQLLVVQSDKIQLPTVPFSNKGLLAELPPPPSGKTGWPWTVEAPSPTLTMPSGFSYPKISIVTPSYNQGQYIEQTIRSVLLQNYPNLEYVICDGGSSDNTLEILKKYSPWLSFWQSKKDRGFGNAINLGFNMCLGDYFGWINSDDFYLPNCFQMVSNCALQYSPEFIYGDSISLYNDDRETCYWQGGFILDRYLRFASLISSHAAFWKSTIHVPIAEDINCAIDYELWLRLLPRRTKRHIPSPLGVFRVQPQSKSSNKRYVKQWEEDLDRISKVHGTPPQPRSYLYYEFTLIQRLYRRLMQLRSLDKQAYNSFIINEN